MPIDPDECRQRALECVRMAQTTKDPDARKIWSEHLHLRSGYLFNRPLTDKEKDFLSFIDTCREVC